MFEYCVVKNGENMKVLEIINACLLETLCDRENPKIQGKKYYQDHIFFFLIQKS